ncbi:unnamed protein product [Acanthoscelides obtectus]|uniref:Uncharacterized protein n=1 Tax=Acanthoscelides obtectus TaxID=200917 RepID=A0A9P0JU24_ACAOB|nr:unnamed protein product [Acanthoscelides obtectus]CAK1627883.1 hypothetical protein AOBTE_LOCUS4883 [Acanthoscelides obtectus]
MNNNRSKLQSKDCLIYQNESLCIGMKEIAHCPITPQIFGILSPNGGILEFCSELKIDVLHFESLICYWFHEDV